MHVIYMLCLPDWRRMQCKIKETFKFIMAFMKQKHNMLCTFKSYLYQHQKDI